MLKTKRARLASPLHSTTQEPANLSAYGQARSSYADRQVELLRVVSLCSAAWTAGLRTSTQPQTALESAAEELLERQHQRPCGVACSIRESTEEAWLRGLRLHLLYWRQARLWLCGLWWVALRRHWQVIELLELFSLSVERLACP